MAGDSSNTATDGKREAETAAKVVLAKHPSVVAGSAPPVDGGVEVTAPKPVDVGARHIGRGLSR